MQFHPASPLVAARRKRLHNTPVNPPHNQNIFNDASMLCSSHSRSSAAGGCEGAGAAEEQEETDDRACAEVLAVDDNASRGNDAWEEGCRSGIGGEGGQETHKRRKGKSDWQRMMRDKGKGRGCTFLHCSAQCCALCASSCALGWARRRGNTSE